MARKPYQSALIPYEDEIIALRHRRPPTSYARIAELLLQKYKLSICRETIFRFVKVRSRGRKVYSYQRDVAPATSKSVKPAPQPKFEFKYSERYNLTRLPDEEAEARRKKLEEEGH